MYRLDFSPQGSLSLASLDKETAQRVLLKLKWLLQNMDGISHLPLKGKLSGFYKLRVRDWRVLYEIKKGEGIVTVHKVGHRSNIYK